MNFTDPPVWTSRYAEVASHLKETREPYTELPYTPVRIAVGAPRFLPGARMWPMLRELMPFGILSLKGKEFEEKYIARLERHGAEEIRLDLKDLYERTRRKPLVLLCYENVKAGEDCHRRMFAEWYLEKTGIIINEAHDLRAVA